MKVLLSPSWCAQLQPIMINAMWTCGLQSDAVVYKTWLVVKLHGGSMLPEYISTLLGKLDLGISIKQFNCLSKSQKNNSELRTERMIIFPLCRTKKKKMEVHPWIEEYNRKNKQRKDTELTSYLLNTLSIEHSRFGAWSLPLFKLTGSSFSQVHKQGKDGFSILPKRKATMDVIHYRHLGKKKDLFNFTQEDRWR